MKITALRYILGIILLIATLLFIPSYIIDSASLCPSNMNPDSVECLDYLRKKLSDINSKQGSIQNKLKDEEYQQLSLQDKLEYISTQMEQTQKVIDTLEVEIATQDVEINILAKEIQDTEDNLSVLKQEIYTLENNLNTRITESYKYSFISPFELFLQSRDMDFLLRRTKYLLETREKEKEYLNDYNTKLYEVEKEEIKLTDEKANLQKKRNDVEIEKANLLNEKKVLDSQKAEKNRLLAESEKREKEMLATLDTLRTQQSSLDNAIMEYIANNGNKMANYGWVTKGTWIGRLRNGPNSVCSTGTHLHFSIDYMNSGAWHGCGKVNP
jgi:chromosome segregation ATPase